VSPAEAGGLCGGGGSAGGWVGGRVVPWGAPSGGCRGPHFLQAEDLALLWPNCVLIPWRQLAQKQEEASCGRVRQEQARRGAASGWRKRGHEKGALGKGTSLAAGRGHVRASRAPLGCPGWLCAGRPPCKQGSVFAFVVVGLLPSCSFGCPERVATL